MRLTSKEHRVPGWPSAILRTASTIILWFDTQRKNLSIPSSVLSDWDRFDSTTVLECSVLSRNRFKLDTLGRIFWGENHISFALQTEWESRTKWLWFLLFLQVIQIQLLKVFWGTLKLINWMELVGTKLIPLQEICPIVCKWRNSEVSTWQNFKSLHKTSNSSAYRTGISEKDTSLKFIPSRRKNRGTFTTIPVRCPFFTKSDNRMGGTLSKGFCVNI